MAANKEVMKTIERLRADRPGLTMQAAMSAATPQDGLTAGLAVLATTYREEAELWEQSGAKGAKSGAAAATLVAQQIDAIAAAFDVTAPAATEFPDNGCTHGDGCPVHPDVHAVHRLDGETPPPPLPRDLSGLDRLIADSRAEQRGHLRELSKRDESAVAAYIAGDADDIPGTPPLQPGGVHDQTAHLGRVDPIDHSDGIPLGVVGGSLGPTSVTVLPSPAACCEHMLNPDEDPRPWCDCDAGQGPEHRRPHPGPCRHLAHLLSDHAAVMPSAFLRAVESAGVPATVPTTWETETMIADGLRPPGAPMPTLGTMGPAPLLGQPGDAGSGYSHSYVPAGGRKLTYADLLAPVAAASLPAHLSHSQIGDAGDCGVKYRAQRVEQLPQVPQWANVGGSAFHAAVEDMERGAARHGAEVLQAAPVETLWQQHFEAEIDRVRASSPVPVSVWRASRKGAEGRAWWEVNGPLMLRRYLDARPDEPTMVGSSGVAAIEIEMIVDVPTPYGPLPFKAILDRVTVRPDGTLTIRDYKTSYERPADTTQLGEYAWVLAMFNSFGPDKANTGSIYGTYFDARRGEWTEPVDLLAAHPFEAFAYRVTAAHAQKLALTTGPTPARPSTYCGGCAVRYACPIMAAKT